MKINIIHQLFCFLKSCVSYYNKTPQNIDDLLTNRYFFDIIHV